MLLISSFTPLLAQQDSMTRIIFYRPKNMQGSGLAFRIQLNEKQHFLLHDNSFYVYDAPPQTYQFYDKRSPKNKLTLKAEAGKTYYVRALLVMGFWSTSTELLLVDSVSATPYLTNGKMKDLRLPLIRPLNRIGIVVQAGGGFDQMGVLMATNGERINLSFGGGIGVNAYFGREVSKHLDLSGGVFYQSSSLTPYVKNASMDFNRFGVALTAAWIIPIQGGYRQRLKLGAGPDLYLNNSLKINTSQVAGGFNDTWEYKKTTGFHVNLNYELNLSDHFSFVYGVQYSHAGFDYQKSSVRMPVNGNPLTSPDGSAIYFRMGFNVHF